MQSAKRQGAIHVQFSNMSGTGLTLSLPEPSPPPTPRSQPAWRAALLSFSTTWFLVPQGTGIIGVILLRLDYQFHGLAVISYLFWVSTGLQLLAMISLYGLRCALFPRRVAGSLRNKPGEMDGLASISISLTSVLQMTAIVLVPNGHSSWAAAVYGLWWANAAVAAVAAVGIPFATTRLHPPGGLATLPPRARLPLIAALTAAAGAGTVCSSVVLGSDLLAPVVVVGYLLIGMGFGQAAILDALFFTRVLSRGRTESDGQVVEPPSVFQSMILCGPWGQGSFALLGLGQAALKGAFANFGGRMVSTTQAAEAMGYASILAGLLSWGLATYWWAFAVLGLLASLAKQWPPHHSEFDLVAWSLVFPWVSAHTHFRPPQLPPPIMETVWLT